MHAPATSPATTPWSSRRAARSSASPAFPTAARAALADTQLRRNLAHATRTIRDKRAGVVAEVDGLGGRCG